MGHELRDGVRVAKNFGELPKLLCYPGHGHGYADVLSDLLEVRRAVVAVELVKAEIIAHEQVDVAVEIVVGGHW